MSEFNHPQGRALRRIVVVALLAGVALAVVGSAHAKGSDSRCAMKGSRTVAKTASARVFKRNQTTYACLFSANRRVRLGTYGSPAGGGIYGQRGFRLAGRYVAFEDFSEDSHEGLFEVAVVNLRSGRLVIRVDTGKTPRVGDFVAGIGPTTRIRLRSTGQVAWIAQDMSTPATRYEVRKREARARGRRTTLLAQGADIAPQSLGLVGNSLSWSQGGARKRATLGPSPESRRT